MSTTETRLRLEKVRGYFALIGPAIDRIAENVAPPVPHRPPATPHHITLLAKHEVSEVKKPPISIPACDDITTPIDLGLGRHENVCFKVVWWPQGNRLRYKLGLAWKDFHVTLSAADCHNVDKGVARITERALLTEEQVAEIIKNVNELMSSSVANMEKAAQAIAAVASFIAEFHIGALDDKTFDQLRRFLSKHNRSACSALTVAYLDANPDSAAANVRYATELSAQDSVQAKRAMGFYAKGARLAKKPHTDAVYRYCVEGIVRCARKTPLRPLFTDEEIAQRVHQTAPMEPVERADILAEYIAHAQVSAGSPDAPNLEKYMTLEPRERMHVLLNPTSKLYQLPRFFSWLLPFRLAVMSTPKSAQDIAVLREQLNISVVVTLTKETPLPAEWFTQQTDIKNVFLAVENYRAPTIEQVDYFINMVTTLPADEAALVHCGGGKGRAGTFAACYLCACGFDTARQPYPVFSAAGAIAVVRALRPGSIETEAQEAFVKRYVQSLYKIIAEPERTPVAEPDAPLVLTGSFFSPRRPQLVVCCGLPGSGKSFLSQQLAERAAYVRISQDDSGSKSACETEFSAAWKAGKRIVIDRCNPTVDARAEWLSMAFKPRDALCVYFNLPRKLCVQRADARPSHPTVPQGRARHVVAAFAKQLVPPMVAEGFACVAEIRSIKAANELLGRLSASGGATATPPTTPPDVLKHAVSAAPSSKTDLHKFPRTRHLFNLGSATRDDLILSSTDAAAFLSTADESTVVIEEKIDGANMGISVDATTMQFKVQNRSHYVNGKSHEQFKKLDKWLQDRSGDLYRVLLGPDDNQQHPPGRYVLYGEWVFAKHSILYSRLPDRFIAFDLYDTERERFVTRDALARTLAGTQVQQIAEITALAGLVLDEKTLCEAVVAHQSQYYDGVVEGFYLRKEKDGVLVDRAKIVRSDFIAGNDHWTKGLLTENNVTY
ncbi:hypothetical protein HDU87_002282 [Geranomyces variabilis]|uniref:Tyrosine specific protein phosphatases domain-containing protein n=1 Tax=Geranomyces variabilis TaxID=109894 RepID=A0AAD5XND3_9FUNG|nr:hypothetical protein HDU87_002282 [Geranomyces variabilis]